MEIEKPKSVWKKIGLFFFILFAFIGLAFVLVFFAVRWHWTDVAGVVDSHSQEFDQNVLGVATSKAPVNETTTLDQEVQDLAAMQQVKLLNLCKINQLGALYPVNAKKIILAYEQTKNDIIVAKMLFAAQLRLEDRGRATNFLGCENALKNNSDTILADQQFANAAGENIFPWMNDEEWSVIREAIVKDKLAIDKASDIAGIEPRLVVASAIVEQVRLFHSQRELFKKFFEPLKILGNANKISLGIMGVKEATAIQTENNLRDSSSPYYLGAGMENALALPSDDPTTARFNRLTDEKNHYYSYLYGAIYLKEMLEQWKKAGYNIYYRPEIVGTLFNVGFPQSKPKPNPKVGGSQINVGDAKYSFGSLAYEFYYSGELLDEFPFVVK